MTRRQMPLVLMLTAGLVTALFTYFKGFDLSSMLIALLATLVIFYMIGCIIRMILDSFEKQDKETVAPEGEVIEKEPEPENENEGSTDNP
ncbi:MAG: hypothetical protein K6A74_11515 [Lachnospiraceae bacterium]|nr:hypothetical protein [Lachnospiraceae bacterium]